MSPAKSFIILGRTTTKLCWKWGTCTLSQRRVEISYKIDSK